MCEEDEEVPLGFFLNKELEIDKIKLLFLHILNCIQESERMASMVPDSQKVGYRIMVCAFESGGMVVPPT